MGVIFNNVLITVLKCDGQFCMSTPLGHRAPRLNIISGFVHESVSRREWHLGQWAQQAALPRVGDLVQSAEGTEVLAEQKKRGREVSLPFSLCLTSELGHQSSPALRLGVTSSIGSPWSSGLQNPTFSHHWLSWVSRLQTADGGTSQLPQLRELIPHKSVCLPVCQSVNQSDLPLNLWYFLLALFLQKPLIHQAWFTSCFKSLKVSK